MSYISNTQDDKLKMLQAIGIKDGDAEKLFKDIPKDLRARSFNIQPGKNEYEVTQHVKGLAEKNNTRLISFLGAGYYDHFIPAAIDALASRSEFYTAYTPYQSEASQGTLQAIYEYQSAICRLTGMDVANASLYDGGTAVFEATMMAMRITKKSKFLIDSGLNPIHKKILYTHSDNLPVDFKETSDVNKLLDDKTAAIILQNPNFFGTITDYTDIIKKAHNAGAVVIMSVYPLSLGILKTPAEMGADIVIGECQSLGIPLSFGGPYLGFMATKKEYVRKMPGRIAGVTTDALGRRGFVLTLQTREQHIRREKATSNICSNQALCALRALIYMCLLGKEGLKKVAQSSAVKAEYAKNILSKIKGIKLEKTLPTFNEFVIELPVKADKITQKMQDKGFIAGFPLGRFYDNMEKHLLVAVTEKHTKQQIDRYAKALELLLCN